MTPFFKNVGDDNDKYLTMLMLVITAMSIDYPWMLILRERFEDQVSPTLATGIHWVVPLCI